MRKGINPYDIKIEDEYNEEDFDKLEKEIIDILRPLHPQKVLLFKLYYGIDEYRYQPCLNYREISDRMIYRGKKMGISSIRRWLEEIMNEVKKELVNRNYVRNIE